MKDLKFKTKCKNCGSEFEYIKKCMNDLPERLYENWRDYDMKLCPICSTSKELDLIEKEIEDRYNFKLPRLIGESMDYINHARKARRRLIGYYTKEHIKSALGIAYKTPEAMAKLKKASEFQKISVEEAFDRIINDSIFYKRIIVLTTTSANTIMEIAKAKYHR